MLPTLTAVLVYSINDNDFAVWGVGCGRLCRNGSGLLVSAACGVWSVGCGRLSY